jgi:hypothetical protein
MGNPIRRNLLFGILNRLMRQSMDRGPVVILVLDERGETFGGFYTVGLNYGEGFVGTGESFLFKFDVRYIIWGKRLA